jgi:hypothetical protein
MKTKNYNDLSELLKIIYWTKFSRTQEEDIINILEECKEEGFTSRATATQICDYLRIERRGNRSEIIKWLER